MVKTFLKEAIIVLLLCLVIILVLGILLYEYVPMTKTIPNTVSYTTPNDVKQELAESQSLDESKVIMTYEVNTDDLNNFKRVQNYRPGKANPFSSYGITTTNGTQVQENGSTTNNFGNTTSNGTANDNSNNFVTTPNNNVTSNSTTSNNTTTSGGQFFQDKGTK